MVDKQINPLLFVVHNGPSGQLSSLSLPFVQISLSLLYRIGENTYVRTHRHLGQKIPCTKRIREIDYSTNSKVRGNLLQYEHGHLGQKILCTKMS